jgi:hypothetical protein
MESGFQMKFEELASRYRGRDGHPTPTEIEHLYTEGCAELLRLEAQLLRLKRRARAAQADSSQDPEAARIAADLQRRLDDVNHQVAAVRRVVRLLRTGVDWTHTQAQAEAS